MIAVYLRQLADALAFDPALAERVLPEIRDHLEEALAAEPTEDRDEAERRIIAKFGDPRELAAQFAPISLMRHTRRAGVAVVLTIVIVMALMKARMLWYAFVQWTLNEEARPIAQLFVTIDRYAFWLAAAIGTASLLYIAWYPTPVRAHAHYQKHLRRAAMLFVFTTVLLGVSVASDLILTALQFRSEFGALVPAASMAIEIGCIVAIVFLVANAARRLARSGIALLQL